MYSMSFSNAEEKSASLVEGAPIYILWDLNALWRLHMVALSQGPYHVSGFCADRKGPFWEFRGQNLHPNLVGVWNGRTEGAGGFYAKTLDRCLVRAFIVRFLGVSSVTSDNVTGLRIYVL